MFSSIRPGGQRYLHLGLGLGAFFSLKSPRLRSALLIDCSFCSRTIRRVRIHAESRHRFKDPVSDSVRTDFIRITIVGLLAIRLRSWVRGWAIGPRESLRQPEAKDSTT